MSGNFKRTKIGDCYITPELNAGKPLVKSGGTQTSGGTTTTATFAAGSTVEALYPEGGSASLWQDLLNGCYIYFLSATTTSALQGLAYRITDTSWVADVLTLTTETMAAAPASGDVCYIFGKAAAKNVSETSGKENLTRDDVMRTSLDAPSSVKGLEVSSGSADLEMIGLENQLGNGDSHVFDVMSHILEGFGSRDVITGTLIDGTWVSKTTGDVDTGHGLVAGDFIMNGGQVVEVTNVSTDTLTVAPAFDEYPVDNSEVYGCEVYTAYDTGHRTFTFTKVVDDQMVIHKGCVISLGCNADFGSLVDAPMDFDSEGWEMIDPADHAAEDSPNKPIPFITGRASFGSSVMCMSSVDFQAGHGREQMVDTCEGRKHHVTSRAATLALSARNKDETLKTDWEYNGTKDKLLVQVGNTPKNTVAFFFNQAQIQDPASMTDNGGISYHDVSFRATNDGDDSSVVNAPKIIRF